MLDLDFSTFPVLRTERLLLREIINDDDAGIFRIRSDQRVMQYIGKEPASTIDDARVLIAKVQADLAANAAISWAITMQGSTEVIGMIGLYRLKPEHHRGELGYALDADHWRKGIMSEAINAVLTCSFERFKFHSIEADTDPENLASNALLQKCGFVREGLFKENYYWRGRFLDSAVWCKRASMH